jgi:hypothetical protein
MSIRYIAGFVSAFYNPLQVPNAPTIGTATSASSTSVSVTFTAPSNVGGGAITGYIATARRTSDGTTISATGSSSPIIVTGLTTSVAYTITVVAVNSFGPSASSVASNSVTPIPAIGEAYGGGYYAGQISTAGNGIADFNLVVGPIASAYNSSLRWKITPGSTSGTSSVIDGPTNSSNMNDASHPAAQFCEGLTIGGFSDWYMPAVNELEICYYNLKPTAATNNTSSGTNTNAVPSRGSNYTGGTPAQTSAAAFQSPSGAENMAGGSYWASTQSAASYAWYQRFSDGFQNPNGYKTNLIRVRAVRRVAV